MSALQSLRESLPDEARDIRLNLDAVMDAPSLSPQQRWTVAVACALATGSPELASAVQEQALLAASREAAEDGRAAAILMAMNNTYYRFKHVAGKPAYEAMPARLRMNRLGRPATDKATFELACLAVSAINGCAACVTAHEGAVIAAGLTEEAVHDAVRIGSTLRAAAVGILAGALALPVTPASPASHA